ncbi:hypothetical protein BH10PSE17_BH10PSE17_23960 [soil metagenome]
MTQRDFVCDDGVMTNRALLAASIALAGALIPVGTASAQVGDRAIPVCVSSVVLVHCDERHRVYFEESAASGAGSDLGRVVVVAPWQRRIRPEETISRLGSLMGEKVAPPMAPTLSFGSRAPSSGLRDDRDNFGLSTECQMSGLPCANQPGRPSTERLNR